jgi:hypothetical protein
VIVPVSCTYGQERSGKVVHRTLGVIAAVLFGLFFAAGAIAFVKTLPSRSCANVTPTNYSSDAVELSGPGHSWQGIPGGHCVEVVSSAAAAGNTEVKAGNGYDLGSAPQSYGGNVWEGVRFGMAAWILWTAAMVFLAAAVAAVPGRRRERPDVLAIAAHDPGASQ